MQSLYAYEQAGGDAQHVIETTLKPDLASDQKNLVFATNLFLRTLDLTEEADAIIGRHTENWDLERIALVDRILLRMAICEILTFEDVPPKVSINEAIEIAKRYSTLKSGPFINGILDAVVLELQRDGRMKKSGRGLVGMQSIVDRAAS